jgi:FAD/FMN-containing dehydrogenase
MGSVSSVGYIGWATHGGYGPFTSNFGLGADQILGTKIVNYEGKMLVANPERWHATRRGGGTLGVIVELTVKVYPLEQVMHSHTVWQTCFANKVQVLGGAIVFE